MSKITDIFMILLHMHTLSLEKFIDTNDRYIQSALSRDIFIYPTDTIYGIWAIVTPETITKIDRAKSRLPGKHYSIIAPDFDRIQQYFNVWSTIEQERTTYQQQAPTRWLTLLLPLKEGDSWQTSVWRQDLSLLSSTSTIWVRYLWDHPFQSFVTQLWQGFITSSCNISWTPPITAIEQLSETVKQHIDICIDGWVLDGQSSIVIEYTTGNIIRS